MSAIEEYQALRLTILRNEVCLALISTEPSGPVPDPRHQAATMFALLRHSEAVVAKSFYGQTNDVMEAHESVDILARAWFDTLCLRANERGIPLSTTAETKRLKCDSAVEIGKILFRIGLESLPLQKAIEGRHTSLTMRNLAKRAGTLLKDFSSKDIS